MVRCVLLHLHWHGMERHPRRQAQGWAADFCWGGGECGGVICPFQPRQLPAQIDLPSMVSATVLCFTKATSPAPSTRHLQGQRAAASPPHAHQTPWTASAWLHSPCPL